MKRLIIHGGCGVREAMAIRLPEYDIELRKIIQAGYAYLAKTNDARATAVYTAMLLEDNIKFNAGTGSKLQQDGNVRMSAALIDSHHKKFSAVANIQNVKNPIYVAEQLAAQHHSMLAGNEATNYAHNVLNLPEYDPRVDYRIQEYQDRLVGQTGTIGVVALDDNGIIAAATSTGGCGFEVAGRVGDSPTIAGNYANEVVGVSCTGIGEDIVNEGVAIKICTRIADGMDLDSAIQKTFAEFAWRNTVIGIILLDKYGNMRSVSTTRGQTLFATHDGNSFQTFFSN